MHADRFRAALRRLGVPDDAGLGVAVSGGPDSLALLLLAHRDRPGKVRAATVDHGIRPESRDEAATVASLCAEIFVPHETLTVQVTGSAQAGARTARYTALSAWCATHGLTWLLTGHHADDQAETLVMRLNRGSGLSGLAGIRAHRQLAPGLDLVRPLLDWRKAELAAIVAAAGFTAVQDPSNTDPAYDRTRARSLLGAGGLDPVRLASSAAHLAEAEAALAWTVERLATERVVGDTLDPAGLPPELLRRLVLRRFAAHGHDPAGPDLARLIAALQAGRTATLGPLIVRPGARWTFSLSPPRRPVRSRSH